jgi:tRNA (guanine-N7-)-methyltransferase
MPNQALHILPRPPMLGELVPAHYFRELEPAEICRAGRPLEVDLGCGDGSFLLEMARHHPERDFIGVERLLGRARKVCRKLTREALSHAKVLRLESRYVVEWLLPAAAVSRLHLLCPDPWPKVRHHRRRLVQVEFLTAVWRVLEPGGEFLFMTDHEDYFHWTEEKVALFGGFERLPWEGDEFYHPKTDFQKLWESEGKAMWRLRCRKPLNAAEARPESP